MFFIMGVGVAVWLLLSGSDVSRVFSRKDAIEMKMQRQQSFNAMQEKTSGMCDLLVQKIESYDPGVNAVYEKNDIQYVINELYHDGIRAAFDFQFNFRSFHCHIIIVPLPVPQSSRHSKTAGCGARIPYHQGL